MNIEVEVGLSCREKGENNEKLSAPLMGYYTGEAVLTVWGEVAPLLAKAAAWGRGEYATEDLLVLIFSKRMQLWTFRENGKIFLAGTTRITQHPQKKVCEIYSLAGCRMAEMWGSFHKALQVWCEALGVQDIETTCRPEIAAKISQLGFIPIVQIMHFQGKD